MPTIFIDNARVSVPFSVKSKEFVAKLKGMYIESEQFVGRKTFVPLVFKGQMLDDLHRLGEYGVTGGSHVQHVSETAVRRFMQQQQQQRTTTTTTPPKLPSIDYKALSTTLEAAEKIMGEGSVEEAAAVEGSPSEEQALPTPPSTPPSSLLPIPIPSASASDYYYYSFPNVLIGSPFGGVSDFIIMDDGSGATTIIGGASGDATSTTSSPRVGQKRTVLASTSSSSSSQTRPPVVPGRTSSTSSVFQPTETEAFSPAIATRGITADARDLQAQVKAIRRAQKAIIPVFEGGAVVVASTTTASTGNAGGVGFQEEEEVEEEGVFFRFPSSGATNSSQRRGGDGSMSGSKGFPSAASRRGISPASLSSPGSSSASKGARLFGGRYVCTVPVAATGTGLLSPVGHAHTFSILPRMEGRWSGLMEVLLSTSATSNDSGGSGLMMDTRAVSTQLVWDAEDGVWRESQTLTTPDGLASHTHLTLVPIGDGRCAVELGTSSAAGGSGSSGSRQHHHHHQSYYHHHHHPHPDLVTTIVELNNVLAPSATAEGVGVVVMAATSSLTGLPVLVETTTLLSDMARVRTVQRFAPDGALTAVYTVREARVIDTVTGALERTTETTTASRTSQGSSRSRPQTSFRRENLYGRAAKQGEPEDVGVSYAARVLSRDPRVEKLVSSFRASQAEKMAAAAVEIMERELEATDDDDRQHPTATSTSGSTTAPPPRGRSFLVQQQASPLQSRRGVATISGAAAPYFRISLVDFPLEGSNNIEDESSTEGTTSSTSSASLTATDQGLPQSTPVPSVGTSSKLSSGDNEVPPPADGATATTTNNQGARSFSMAQGTIASASKSSEKSDGVTSTGSTPRGGGGGSNNSGH